MLPLTCALVSTAWRTALSKEPAKLVAAASAWSYGKPPLRRRGPASQRLSMGFRPPDWVDSELILAQDRIDRAMPELWHGYSPAHLRRMHVRLARRWKDARASKRHAESTDQPGRIQAAIPFAIPGPRIRGAADRIR